MARDEGGRPFCYADILRLGNIYCNVLHWAGQIVVAEKYESEERAVESQNCYCQRAEVWLRRGKTPQAIRERWHDEFESAKSRDPAWWTGYREAEAVADAWIKKEEESVAAG